ncbi:helix-turn-helix domain-containing protein [Paenibacillus rigui]|uniref:helix-turn-helix domain-containing protein n=1 Tax=Paenibacillus rigui TaxID=554312 RepID=UPI0015C5F738|nr:helix-turn-helix domain-containing protein [Paenibacillus rigui]
MLCFIARGEGTAVIDGTAHALQPLQLCFLPPGCSIEVSMTGQEITYYVIVFEALQAEKRRGRWQLTPIIPRSATFPHFPAAPVPTPESREVERRIEQMYALSRADQKDPLRTTDPHATGEALSQPPLSDPNLPLQSLLELLLHSGPRQQTEAERNADPGLELCIAYMREHYQEKISRKTLASLAKLTPNAFCRSFKRTTGLSPTDYLNRIRIEQAKQLLSPAASVKEVAAAVGYGSEYYFSRIFKETVGLSPSHYIKRERLRVATASRCGLHENLSSMGMEAVAAVDCYRYPWMNDEEYHRQLLSQLEQLRLAKPDLIVADYAQRSCYEQFKQIAPTVLLEHHLDWRVAHRSLAGLVGREREAEHSLTRLQESVNEVRRRLLASAENYSRVAVVQMLPQRIRVQGTVLHPLNDLIYQELGLQPGSGVPRNKMRDERFSRELPGLEADHLFIIKQDTPPPMEGEPEQLPQAMPMEFNPSGRKRTVHLIPNWLVMSWTPQGRSRIAEELVNKLTQRKV